MKPVYGNHLGWVINTQEDPEQRQRVQVFVPYLTNTLYKEWNQELTDIRFKNPNELGTQTLTVLQQVLPWAECASPIWGDSTSMKLNGPTGVLSVNGGSTFNPGAGVGGLDNVLSSGLQQGANANIYPFWDDIKSKYSGVQNWGIWGDAAHRLRKSDHNTGDALDVGISSTAQGTEISQYIINQAGSGGNPYNVKYLIFNGQIWSPSKGLRPYTGKNPHSGHIHISFNRGNSTGSTASGLTSPTPDQEGDQEGAANPLLSPVSDAAANPQKYMGLDSDKTANGITGQSSTGRDPRLNDRSPPQFGTTSSGSKYMYGVASSYGFKGDKDNGYNSLGMLRGQQPWYGQYPTVALNPNYAKQIGVSLPSKNSNGSWNLSNSLVTLQYGGRTVTAVYDENGMYITPNSQNKVVDLTPEALNALGVSKTGNVYGVAVAGGGNVAGGEFDTLPPIGGGVAQDGTQDPSDILQVNRAGNQGSEPDTTIGGNGSPNGMFSVPAFGSKVWVFFYDGDVQKPIYFASVIEPSSGQTS